MATRGQSEGLTRSVRERFGMATRTLDPAGIGEGGPWATLHEVQKRDLLFVPLSKLCTFPFMDYSTHDSTGALQKKKREQLVSHVEGHMNNHCVCCCSPRKSSGRKGPSLTLASDKMLTISQFET